MTNTNDQQVKESNGTTFYWSGHLGWVTIPGREEDEDE